ncbi:MAG: DNA polymerase III subunit alpha [Bacteriovoracaceae bacterium]|nr:DNA polymerase III subunit alpha [Bacteriovoracaceae bacterium]
MSEISESLLIAHPKNFVHLHLHTQYSLLDGALRLKDLFAKCQEFGMPAVASTDHGNMFGAIDFYTQAKKAGIKPLIGSEIYYTPGSRFEKRQPKSAQVLDSQDENESKFQIHHLVLICKNLTGYRNLCQLLSRAYMEGFYYKPRVDMALLKEYSEGLVATTACLKGEVAYNIFTKQEDRAVKAIMQYRELFGDDFYLEIQENTLNEQKLVNEKLIKFANSMSIPLVATNDVHYLNREDAAAQEVLLCIQTGKTFLDEKRMKLSVQEFYLKSPSQMRDAFHYFPEACDNTLRIADKCNLNFKWTDDKGKQIYHLPKFPIVTGETEDDFFKKQSVDGLQKRFEGPHFKKLRLDPKWESEIKPMYEKRLIEECEMITRMGFSGYFLIVSDFILWAKNHDIPVGPGRGSGAGSLVAYSLFITNINPIPYHLLFERFINPERVSMPDFDVDFCQDRREEVIEYVTKKYGSERVGQIITFGKLQAKAVIRDVCRVYGIPYSEADLLAKLIPEELGITLKEALEKEPKMQEMYDSDQKIRRIIDISMRLEGLLRHASIHAAGVIITNEPLVHYCPLYRGREGEQVVQFDKDFSEKIGLIKFDFLGLKTLTVIQNAVNLIKKNSQSSFDIEAIDLEDRAVFDLISSGNTTGVFQLESSGMKDLCKRIAPDTIDDITAINALYRPGPLGSGMVDDFIEIKHGRKQIHYAFSQLETVLRDTYGIIVYQEQVMNISRIIAGYTLGQADMLRRAMGKKKADEMERHKQIFIEGAQKNNFDTQKAGELFDLMAMFAEYGFNKSHAVAYAIIAYQTAFLKTHFQGEFFAALLGSEMGNTDKITLYINDAKENGLEILPPSVNESLWSFNVIGNQIRFGMGAVKNVGQGAVEEIIRIRNEAGNFTSFVEFCIRMHGTSVNRKVLESLIKVGAFDDIDKNNRRTLLENLDYIVEFSSKRSIEQQSKQTSLFELTMPASQNNPTLEIELKVVDDFADKEKLAQELSLIGMYVSGHPLDPYREQMKQMSGHTIAEVMELVGEGKRDMQLAGMFTSHKALMTKKGDKMGFATLEDMTGKMECVVFPKTYAEFAHCLTSDEAFVLMGTLNLSETPRKFFPRQIIPLSKYVEDKVDSIKLKMTTAELEGGEMGNNIERLKKAILNYPGSVPVHLLIQSPKGEVTMNLGERFFVNPHPKFIQEVDGIFKRPVVEMENHSF